MFEGLRRVVPVEEVASGESGVAREEKAHRLKSVPLEMGWIARFMGHGSMA